MSQYEVLRAIREMQRPATTSEVIAYLRIHGPRYANGSNVSTALSRLESLGFVRRAGTRDVKHHPNSIVWEVVA